jgi:hypothetical protein
MKPVSLVLLISVFLVSCTNRDEYAGTGNCSKYVVLNYSNYDSLKSDPIYLLDVRFDGDCLILNLQYGGGCRDHQVDLALILPECGTPPLPPTTFEIRHNANNDGCKALITREYSFNISGIREDGKKQVEFILDASNASGNSESKTYTYKY